jgi:CheY-like chemotaxis protein
VREHHIRPDGRLEEPGPAKHILLVDDDDATLALLSTLIGGNGFPHATASHGAEALEKARHSPPAAIVADLLMPVMDGYTLFPS